MAGAAVNLLARSVISAHVATYESLEKKREEEKRCFSSWCGCYLIYLFIYFLGKLGSSSSSRAMGTFGLNGNSELLIAVGFGGRLFVSVALCSSV